MNELKIINIGDELLIGQVVNSNASWLSAFFNRHGFSVNKVEMIGDREEDIQEALQQALATVSLVVLTGGLGPTADDKTKEALCHYFNKPLIADARTLSLIEDMLSRRGMIVSERNRDQAKVPEGATVLYNRHGTAPGIWMEDNGKVVVALPGVPHEMKSMSEDELLPLLKQKFSTEQHVVHKVVQTIGIAESDLADILSAWETALPTDMSLAYLPRPGIIRLRLTAKGKDLSSMENRLQEKVEQLKLLISKYIWSYEDNQLEEVVENLLRESKSTLALAESCTGGYLSHLITSIPGSSVCFKGSVVCYSNEVKRHLLNVREQNLKKHGAVSEEVVSDMAINAMDFLDTDYAVAISGIAGPEGGTPDKPVGTVWIAVASNTRIRTQCFHFGTMGGRLHIIQRASNAALNLLREEILKNIE
ncbi:MAG: competence/damage-inducible protein A [Bacteroidales bacterium]|jgi:nicotinamide-nucleotide amidase|nr:competence/damage-inducible protein A [Bacteroidales bacterium]